MTLLRRKNTRLSQAVAGFLAFAIFALNIPGIVGYTKNTLYQNSVAFAALTKYSTDLTKSARDGKIRSNTNFEADVNRLIKSMTDGDFRQPALLDETGESQELVIEQLADRIAKGDVPANLKDKRLLMLETDLIYSNAKSEAEVSQIVKTILNGLVAANGETILFIDELTNFTGEIQNNNSLMNSLRQGKIKIIGGSSKAAYSDKIENKAEIAALFEPIMIGNPNYNSDNENQKQTAKTDGFRGDNVSADLREMMAQDPSGKKRVQVIIQAKDADNQSLRAIMTANGARLEERIGVSDTLVVNLPLSAVTALAQSGIVNYMSPDRQMKTFGHLEATTGTEITRSQPGTANRPAYALDGSG